MEGCTISQFICFCWGKGLFFLCSSVWYSSATYTGVSGSCCYYTYFIHLSPCFSYLCQDLERGALITYMKPVLSLFLPFLHTSFPAQTAPLRCSCYSPLALLWPACVLPWVRLRLCSRDCATVKSPSELQAASTWVSWRCHLHHKPAPLLSLSHKHIHTRLQHSCQTRATYSSTVVKLWCFLYHVCQWAISLSIFFDYNR